MVDASTLIALALPPIPASITFPPLLPITDPELAELVFTHSSYNARPRRANVISLEGDGVRLVDNEKLEHVGDSLLGGIVTVLLDEKYPSMKHGPATMLKAQLVQNSLLAQLSIRYGFPDRLICSPEARWTLIRGEKTSANLFEAYIAGLFYSYIHSPAHIPSPPLTPRRGTSTNATVSATIDSLDEIAPRPVKRTHGQALDHLEKWLKPLFSQLAEWVLQELQDEHARLGAQMGRDVGDDVDDLLAVGSTARLNEHFIARHGTRPNFQATSTAGMSWTVRCEATTKDGRVYTGEATRSTKKAAMTIAAWQVCQELRL